MSVFDASGPSGSPSAGNPKRDLRRDLLAARRAMTDQSQRIQDAEVCGTLASWLDEIQPATVAAYAPMSGEPGGPDLPALLASIGVRVLLPVVLDDRDLDWAVFDGALVDAALGLREPPGARLGVDAIRDADVVVVPALAVDRSGMRLGRGGGSYDRALARVGPAAIVIAALYDGELLDRISAEPHDQPVDAVVINGTVTMLSSGYGLRPAGR